MTRMILAVFVCLTMAASAACSFTLGAMYETDQANKLIDEANALDSDGDRLLTDSMKKYAEILDPALASDDPFAAMGELEDPLKQLHPPLDAAQAKFRDAAQKSDEASRLKIQDWFRDYLATNAEVYRKKAEVAAQSSKLVKLVYDPSVTTEEEFQVQGDAINTQLAELAKQVDDLRKKSSQIKEAHKDDFEP